MRETCKQVSFRLDFYSIPGFASAYTQMIDGKFKKDAYAHRELTDEEKLIVDVDSAAESFAMNIGDLIERKNFIFKRLTIGESKVNLYISPFYIFASLDSPGDFDHEVLKNLFISFNLEDILNKQELLNITVMTQHNVAGGTEKEVFKVLDRSAFPIMDDTQLANGRYLDTHDYEKCSIDLLRIIRKGEIDGEPRVEVSLQTRAVPSENLELDRDNGISDQLADMLKFSLDEVTRCFI